MKQSRDTCWLWYSVCCAWLLNMIVVTGTTLSPSRYPSFEPTSPTDSPTFKPSHFPSVSPTDYPTVAIDSGDVIVISASVPVKELNDTVIGKESAYLELLFADSSGLDFNEVTINIVSVGIKTSTVAETCNATIVSGINYEVISEDSSTYTLVRRSLDTGSFFDSYDAGLMNVFPQRVAICDELVRNASDIIESYEEMSYDEAFPPDADPTITEELWSEYLFFGFFTSLLGVVWLWYLRSDVDDGNVYVDNGANGGNTGIEMQPKQPPKGTNVASDSSNALLTDGAPQDTKLSDYAVQSEDGKLVLDQRDSKRSP